MYQKIIDKIKSENLNVHCIEVFHKGKTVLHYCFHEEKRYPVYSATKSVTATAVAIACDEGKISPDSPLWEFLENRYRNLMTDEFKKLTIGRFMTMNVGNYPFRPQGNNWLEYILSLKIDHNTGFHYSNIPAYLVGTACENAVGGNLMDYLEPRLFEPLGIKPPVFVKSPEEHFYGATGMELTVNELSRFGQLYLNKGVFNNTQVISEKRAVETVTPKILNENGGYGYFFWTNTKGFSINGKWGQRCLVYPEKQLIVTYLSDIPENSERVLAIAENFAESL